MYNSTIFKVYTCLPDKLNWYPYKHYRSKQAALNRIKLYRSRSCQPLYFKIIKSDIYTNDFDKVVYDESVDI